MANVPTDRRYAVKVLLRPGTPYAGAPAARRIGGYMVMIAGEARAEDWPGRQRVGDLEGVVWTTSRQVSHVVQNLLACEGVVAARGDDD